LAASSPFFSEEAFVDVQLRNLKRKKKEKHHPFCHPFFTSLSASKKLKNSKQFIKVSYVSAENFSFFFSPLKVLHFAHTLSQLICKQVASIPFTLFN
jgi:hypothetical protein